MATQAQGVWGIDIGQCALKAIRLEVIDDQVTATAFDYVEHPKILSQPDADPDQLIREALEKFLSRNSLKGDLIAIGVPGQSGLARFVKLPPVEEKKIPDIVRFEAKQQIPFPLEEVIWDFQKLGSGTVTDGFAMDTEVGLFAMKRDMINRSLQQFKDVNIEVHIVQMAPLALCNYVSYDLLKKGEGQAAAEGGEEAAAEEEDASKKRCVVALDIGTDNSNLVITDGERIIWQRPIPHGGNHFTRALTKDLKLTFAKAEHLKRNATKSPDLKKILSALKPVLNDFVGEVQRSLGYFTNTHRDAKVAYLIGLGNAFRLPGLQKFLTEKLQIDVRKLQKLERVTGESVLTAPAFTQNVLSFAVAYGLALQGLKRTRLQTNLLPHEIRVERLVRAKKPWAVTAAAGLLIGAAAVSIGYGMQYKAVAAKSVETAINSGNNVVQQAKTNQQNFDSKLSQIKEDEDKVRNIVAGQDERLDWILLDRFLNEALPVPALRVDGKLKGPWPPTQKQYVVTNRDGKDVAVPFTDQPRLISHGKFVTDPSEVKAGDEVAIVYQDDPLIVKNYWTPKAQEAYLKLWQRQAEGKTEAKAEEEGTPDLIQVNLEAVDARWTRSLKNFWDSLKKDDVGKLADVVSKDKPPARPDTVEAPDSKGWVVELRGYTYFRPQDARQFLIDTLCHRLAALSYQKKEANKDNEATSTEEQAKASAKPATKEELWRRVIKGQISHVVLYHYDYDKNPEPGQFQFIGSSALDSLLGGGSGTGKSTAPGGMDMASMMKGMGGPKKSGKGNTSEWQSLLSGGGGGGAGKKNDMSSMMMGMGGNKPPARTSGGARPSGARPGRGMMGPGMMGPGMMGPGMMPGGRGPGAPGTQPGEQGQQTTKAGPTRTEFQILFIWKEPLPSDVRKGENQEGEEGSDTGTDNPGGMAGMMMQSMGGK